MTLAIVSVLPVPVAPSRTWCSRPFVRPSVRRSMACGWSPVGSNGATNLNSGTAESYHPAIETERAFVARLLHGVRSGRTDGGAFWYHPPISTPVPPSRDCGGRQTVANGHSPPADPIPL